MVGHISGQPNSRPKSNMADNSPPAKGNIQTSPAIQVVTSLSNKSPTKKVKIVIKSTPRSGKIGAPKYESQRLATYDDIDDQPNFSSAANCTADVRVMAPPANDQIASAHSPQSNQKATSLIEACRLNIRRKGVLSCVQARAMFSP